METEYIEKQAAIKELCETYEHEYPTASGAFDEYATRIVPNVLRNLPPADVRPVVRGRWEKTHRHHNNNRLVTGPDKFGETHTISIKEEIEYDWMRCPYCHAAAADNFQNYCPNCGADMRGDADG